ncbi:hypothetical protein PVAP13_3NG274841 [Panicum virgatum]|uniref:Uncharacterized protein n=1 Tax=Panicum virgatum TaxID=38727 RepID=A0A8T0UC61_PANVG|nr:hypothetical protein PVAP13_3NG274841 [Panicum virgatum]
MNKEFYLSSFVNYLRRLRTFAGGYVIVDEKLPRFVVPDLTDFKLKPYVSQCARDLTASTASSTSAETAENKS